MERAEQRRVVGLLGVGFDHEDGHIRVTKSDHSQVVMGSSESHKILQNMCLEIEEAVRLSGRELNDYTPEELMKLVEGLLLTSSILF